MHSPLELGNRICDFLQEQGGPYESLAPEVIYNVFWSLGAGHYLAKPSNTDDIETAFQRPEDVAAVQERVKPLDITHGTVMYVAEAASKIGMTELVRALRRKAVGMKGVFWHRPAKADKVYNFPSQRGS